MLSYTEFERDLIDSLEKVELNGFAFETTGFPLVLHMAIGDTEITRRGIDLYECYIQKKSLESVVKELLHLISEKSKAKAKLGEKEIQRDKILPYVKASPEGVLKISFCIYEPYSDKYLIHELDEKDLRKLKKSGITEKELSGLAFHNLDQIAPLTTCPLDEDQSIGFLYTRNLGFAASYLFSDAFIRKYKGKLRNCFLIFPSMDEAIWIRMKKGKYTHGRTKEEAEQMLLRLEAEKIMREGNEFLSRKLYAIGDRGLSVVSM